MKKWFGWVHHLNSSVNNTDYQSRLILPKLPIFFFFFRNHLDCWWPELKKKIINFCQCNSKGSYCQKCRVFYAGMCFEILSRFFFGEVFYWDQENIKIVVKGWNFGFGLPPISGFFHRENSRFCPSFIRSLFIR